MPNGLRNWKYRDVTKFLSKNNFTLVRQKSGSHEFWQSKKSGKIVNVNWTKREYPVKTLEIMISQSGLSKKDWRDANI